MEWGATAKEAEKSNFFKEVPKIFKNFWMMYAFVVPCIGGMIFLATPWAPRGWDITGITATVPLAVMLASHAILPVSTQQQLYGKQNIGFADDLVVCAEPGAHDFQLLKVRREDVGSAGQT